MTDSSRTRSTRLPAPLDDTVQELADIHDVSIARLFRMWAESQVASELELLDDETATEFEEYREQAQARRARERAKEREAERRERGRELNDLTYFRKNIKDSVFDWWQANASPYAVKKNLKNRSEQVYIWYDEGLIDADRFEGLQRFLYTQYTSYHERYVDQGYDLLEDDALAGMGGTTSDTYDSIVETAADALAEGREPKAKRLRDDAHEDAPAHMSQTDVWDDIRSRVRDRYLHQVKQRQAKGMTVTRPLSEATRYDPEERNSEQLLASLQDDEPDDPEEPVLASFPGGQQPVTTDGGDYVE